MVEASLIWLNYNSSRFIDVALRSIESVLGLDFDDYEVIVVDNASTDGSFEAIKKFVEEKKPSGVRVRFVRSDANRGYAGGMNLGWEAKDPDAKYVAFLNNDLIVEPNSLRGIIEHMESDEKIAAASGLIYFGDGRTIYSAGGYITENWIGGGICMHAAGDECPELYKPHYVTYADGAYAVVSVGAVRSSCPEGKPFIDETFMYLDDSLLSLILWNKGYRVLYAPVEAGVHYAHMSAKSINYYSVRGSTALIGVLDTKYSWAAPLYLYRRSIGYRLLCVAGRKKYCVGEASRDGLRLAEIIRKRLGYKLDLYKAPYIKISFSRFIGELLLISKIGLIHHKMLTPPSG